MKKATELSIVLLCIFLLMTGCGSHNRPSEDNEPSQALYPITIDACEILVGQTTVQTLLDGGLKITTVETDADGQYMEVELDPDMELKANTYYGGGTIWITEKVLAHISVVTDEKPLPMSEAVIAMLDFSLALGETSDLDRIIFNGVPVSALGREKVTELFPEFIGDANMRSGYGKDYEYSLSFNIDGTGLNSLSVKKNYNVNWNTGK